MEAAQQWKRVKWSQLHLYETLSSINHAKNNKTRLIHSLFIYSVDKRYLSIYKQQILFLFVL